MSKQVKPVTPKHDEKGIKLTVYLYTNKIAQVEGQILPKHANGGGIVHVTPNESHGIPERPDGEHFHTPLGIASAINKMLVRAGIVFTLTKDQLRKANKLQR